MSGMNSSGLEIGFRSAHNGSILGHRRLMLVVGGLWIAVPMLAVAGVAMWTALGMD